MAEDEDLLDATKEWEDRCKEAERQSATIAKAVNWMSQRIKTLESERDSANLQIEAMKPVVDAAIMWANTNNNITDTVPWLEQVVLAYKDVTLKQDHESGKS